MWPDDLHYAPHHEETFVGIASARIARNPVGGLAGLAGIAAVVVVGLVVAAAVGGIGAVCLAIVGTGTLASAAHLPRVLDEYRNPKTSGRSAFSRGARNLAIADDAPDPAALAAFQQQRAQAALPAGPQRGAIATSTGRVRIPSSTTVAPAATPGVPARVASDGTSGQGARGYRLRDPDADAYLTVLTSAYAASSVAEIRRLAAIGARRTLGSATTSALQLRDAVIGLLTTTSIADARARIDATLLPFDRAARDAHPQTLRVATRPARVPQMNGVS